MGRMIRHDGIRAHVMEQGEGPGLLCIHGASANGREFLPTIAPALAGEYRLLIMDRPGHGHSPAVRRAREILTQAKAAAAVVAASGAGPVLVLGHSFGCAVGLRLALERPDLVRGLVLAAPACNPFPPKHAWHTRAAALPIVGPVFAHAIVTPLGPVLAKPAVANTFAPAAAPEGYAHAAGMGLLFRRRQFVENARVMVGISAEFAAQAPLYPTIDVPVVIITSDDDRVVSPKRHAYALNDAIDQAELIVTPKAGHMPHQIRPDIVAQAVRRVDQRAR
jgi:pimeloyl-ACP methyl ester carboxylesterase